MENLASDLIELLRYLLPNFLSAWVFYGLTPFVKPSQFERIVQALILSLIVQATASILENLPPLLLNSRLSKNWNLDTELLNLVISAVLVGFVFAYFANRDKFHQIARKIGISKETSYPSEWYGEFSNNVTYVVLHLAGC